MVLHFCQQPSLPANAVVPLLRFGLRLLLLLLKALMAPLAVSDIAQTRLAHLCRPASSQRAAAQWGRSRT